MPLDIHLDVETPTTFQQPDIRALPRDRQILAMQFGLAITYDHESGWRTWLPEDLRDLWITLKRPGIRVCGWNICDFDIPVIRNAAKVGVNISNPDCLDLFQAIREETGRWYKLDAITQANLGKKKTSDGLQAAEWLQRGTLPDTLRCAMYCRDDVELEHQVYQKFLAGEPIILPARPERKEFDDLILQLDDVRGLLFMSLDEHLARQQDARRILRGTAFA